MSGLARMAVLGLAVSGLGWSPMAAAGQNADAEAAMVAAGEWARTRLPAGRLGVDPHRTGRSTDRALPGRIASALDAEVGTLEQVRTCADPTDPSTCRLSVPALIAIGAPSIRGDGATVRVYAWYRQDSPRAPVAKASWEVRFRRTASGWSVDGERRLD